MMHAGKLCALTLLVLCFVGRTGIALAAPPANFDARVEEVRKAAGVPGMAIAIVEDGKVTLAKGYGVRELDKPAPVDADTIFPIASVGKAFTVAALATLVDEGKIGWDDKVIDHIPWFRMYDPWVTREMTVRDLLVHRSGLGLGEGDLLFVPRTKLTRRESVERLRHLKPATSFRSAYAYDNVLYMVAGQLIEEVTGETWETYVAEHVLKPAGMVHSTTDLKTRFATADRARPHARIDGALRGLGDQQKLAERDVLGRNAAPAGGIAASASDMARWMLIQLARGKLPDSDGRLFSEAQSKEMWTPVVMQPIGDYPGDLKPLKPDFSTYALGWGVKEYRGTKIVTHTGGDLGFISIVVLIPDKNVGFSIFVNSEGGSARNGLAYELLDHYLGLPKGHWPEKIAAFYKEQAAQALAVYRKDAAKPAKVGPSLPLADYAGDYADPWYGPISIRGGKSGLTIDFKQTPRMTGRLEHWQYDTFRTVWDDRSIEPAYVTFSFDADGKIAAIAMQPVSPLADFSYDYQDLHFTPVEQPR